MDSSALDGFCNSTFWDSNISWNTDYPRLPPCFQKTVLVWIPSLFLWVFSPIDVYYSLSSKARNIPWNWRNLSKLNAVGLLIAFCIFDYFYSSFFNVDAEWADISAPLIKIVTLILCAGLMVSHVKRGQRTSGVLFLFWLLILLFGIPQLVWDIEAIKHGKKEPTQISYFIYYIISCIVFILYFFVDLAPQETECPKAEKPHPEESSSFPSRLTFAWFDPLALLGFKRPLVNDDLWSLSYADSAAYIFPTFNKYWTKSVKKNSKIFFARTAKSNESGVDFSGIGKAKTKSSSVIPAICKSFGITFAFGAFLKLIYDLLGFVSPQILRLLIDYVNSDQPLWQGLFYSVLLFAVAAIQTLLSTHHNNFCSIVGLRMRTALTTSIYRKALRLSNAARKESTVGEVVNLMAVDAERIMEMVMFLNMIWSAPLVIGLALFFLWQLLGPSVLTGLAVMILMLPINSVIANRVKLLQMQQMKHKDDRVKMMNEILSGIKVLKLYAWEPTFEKLVMDIRQKEIKVLKQTAYFNASTSFIWACTPFLVTLITFATYILLDENNVLDAQKAFVSLSLFNILRNPLAMLPMIISVVIQTIVSLKRINKFMNSEELDPSTINHNTKEDKKSSKSTLITSYQKNENGELNKLLPSHDSDVDDQCLEDENLEHLKSQKVDTDTLPSEEQENKNNLKVNGDPPNPKVDSLVMEKATFSWGCDEEPTLHNINLRVKKGSLVAFVGAVGSGKSSLISSFLGDMDKKTGQVNIYGTVAYVPQLAWIQNKTLQENILFGKSMDKKSYTRVIKACALEADLEMLPGGDQTEIGEKGINLSGGQKQRVSLARAVYADCDIYFLDDPLSAVDSHVGKHIFENVISSKGILHKKTRVFVTHSITFLPEVDVIVVLKDGTISEIGSYKELLERKGDFSEYLTTYLQEVESADIDEIALMEQSSNPEYHRQLSKRQSVGSHRSSSSSMNRRTSNVSQGKEETPLEKQVGERLTKDETAEVGTVKLEVYKHYVLSIGLGLAASSISFNLISQGFFVGSSLWLSKWTSENRNTSDRMSDHIYLEIYGLLGLFQTLSCSVSSLLWYLGCVSASVVLHNKLLTRIMRGPLSFFDTTQLGRILNRFTSDISTVDLFLPRFMEYVLTFGGTVFGTIFVISITTPIFLIPAVPLTGLYIFLQRYYVATSRQLKRLESIARSPVYSHFSESVSGSSIIRAYNVQERFIKESDEKVDFYQKCSYPGLTAARWLAVRLEMVGNLVIFFAALFAVLSKDTLSSGIVGLLVSSALQVTQILNWLVKMTGDIETNIVSVERIKEYSEIPQEAAWELECNALTKDWPEEGKVGFLDYKVRYREGLELVLKGINITISGGEKVGIVGRTGAGKSSLTLCLFRIIEAAEGKIIIDGIDISHLGLQALRSRLTIIPQDPVIFSGSLRLNLDPFNQYSDEQIWYVLELAHLKSYVKGLSTGLQHELSEGGENLSVGQRQLICLARALLRKTKILILDEATAAVDLETDELIQKTIRTEFKDCTVLTIAHRLNTVLDSDRVLVLDKGMVAEFDSPGELLLNKSSIFYSMVHNAGLI